MDSERKEFWIRAFHAMSQVWPFFEPTPDRIRVYDSALTKYPVKDLAAGCAHVLARQTGSSPTPGDIRAGILKEREARATSDPTPLGLLEPTNASLRAIVENVSAKLSLPQPARHDAKAIR